ncbi:Phospholipid N-methyltransferase [Saccharopolyspora antimicrobica]|uniref:Phosphatidylethanolamine N-methyltransferase /phosphatidyl-N-methylethanolamine N-methyltransferase n=1 Tax=Saccharopolyspora antimicrobica TaxID=455193 RepID=A0A1I5DK25_9PSEU|nr:methyltransferase domain-containing protein [Saccharopolyspora antimicrobica]RKT85085.1 phosphatidylethanolamine N-methyltransferase /phosphatidyl-N-methylethanolamine N-methyltransferase [Saccharopolyspora antimicrobica]SFN99615.1 Phospholipid N-methyltransferase [Saccharopolyspora antimicrobica]
MTPQQDRHDPRTAPWLDRAAQTATRRLGEYGAFFRTAVRNPRMVGAATPTSAAVAATVAQVVPTTGSPVVVELGPGTGSLSNGIHERLPHGARHIGIELGEGMVEHLREHKPWLEVVHADAGDLLALLDKLGIAQVDAVISSIPWSLMPGDAQDHVLHQAAAALSPQGAFTALTYLPADRTPGGRRFRNRLEHVFDEVLTHTTWRNLPPILHYICRRPLR